MTLPGAYAQVTDAVNGSSESSGAEVSRVDSLRLTATGRGLWLLLNVAT